jgi:hypothetical protein
MCQTPQQKVSGFPVSEGDRSRDERSCKAECRPADILQTIVGGPTFTSCTCLTLRVEALEPLLETVAVGALCVEVDGPSRCR